MGQAIVVDWRGDWVFWGLTGFHNETLFDCGAESDSGWLGDFGGELGGVEEGEEDAAEGGFAAGGVVPLL
jgi:hypothetical protein